MKEGTGMNSMKVQARDIRQWDVLLVNEDRGAGSTVVLTPEVMQHPLLPDLVRVDLHAGPTIMLFADDEVEVRR